MIPLVIQHLFVKHYFFPFLHDAHRIFFCVIPYNKALIAVF